LPRAHVEAPTLGSIILAGLLLKLGAWGLFRFSALFSGGVLVLVEVLSVGGILLGCFFACFQRDGKRLVAFSSICHINFLGLVLFFSSSLGKSFSVLIIFSHGLSASIIF